MTTTPLADPVDISPPGTSGWQVIDVSPYVSADATGVIIFQHDGGGAGAVGVRAAGSTDDWKDTPSDSDWSQVWYAPLNANKEVELYDNGASGLLTYYLAAYFEDEAAWLSSPVDITPGAPGWQIIDITSHVYSGLAIGAICVHVGAGSDDTFGYQHPDSTDDITGNNCGFNHFICPVDGNEQFEAYLSNITTGKLFLLGYVTDGWIFDVNRPTISNGADSSWNSESITTSALLVIGQGKQTGGGGARIGLRENASVNTDVSEKFGAGTDRSNKQIFAGVDSGAYESYFEGSVEIRRVGYAETVVSTPSPVTGSAAPLLGAAQAGGAGGIDYSGSAAPQLAAPIGESQGLAANIGYTATWVPAAEAAGAGALVFTGAANALIAGLAAAADGQEGIAATGGASLSPPDSAGDGQLTLIGDAAGVVAALLAQGSSSGGIAGQADPILAAPSLDSAGAESHSGGAAATLSPMEAAAIAAHSFRGQGSAAFAGLLAAAQGGAGIIGLANALVAALEGTSEGVSVVSGTSNAGLAAASGDATGAISIEGAAAMIVAALAAAGDGFIDIGILPGGIGLSIRTRDADFTIRTRGTRFGTKSRKTRLN